MTPSTFLYSEYGARPHTVLVAASSIFTAVFYLGEGFCTICGDVLSSGEGTFFSYFTVSTLSLLNNMMFLLFMVRKTEIERQGLLLCQAAKDAKGKKPMIAPRLREVVTWVLISAAWSISWNWKGDFSTLAELVEISKFWKIACKFEVKQQILQML